MRKIEFRGKQTDNGNWVYGYLSSHDTINVVVEWQANESDTSAGYSEEIEIISSTVGQYTGEVDQGGISIYEGDILRMITDFGEVIDREVWFGGGCFQITGEKEDELKDVEYVVQAWGANIVGNIHDNPSIITNL